MSDYAKPEEFGLADLLCCAASREVADNEIVFAGTGLPMVAIMLAQKTHAPNLKLIFEAGTLDGRPPELPTSVGDARCEMGASRSSGLNDAFSIAQRGLVDLGYLGGAEVDLYGNVNTTCIGNYLEPELRLTGSGGNPDINSFARRTVFIMVHEKRRFVENVSYITSPGWRVKKWPGGEFVHRRELYGAPFAAGHRRSSALSAYFASTVKAAGCTSTPATQARDRKRSRRCASSTWISHVSRERPNSLPARNCTSSMKCWTRMKYSSPK